MAAPAPNVRAGLFGTSLNDDVGGGDDMDEDLLETHAPMNGFGGGGARGRGRGGRGLDVKFQVRSGVVWLVADVSVGAVHRLKNRSEP